MTYSQWIGDRIPTLLRPSILLLTSLYHFIMTILEIIFLEWRPFKLFNVKAVRFQSFARLWKHNGEAMSEEMPGPTFELLSRCEGVVLDVGPGSGEVLSRFNPDHIIALYGAEPAKDLHPGLLQKAAKYGFKSKFHALLCGAEPESLIPALHKVGIVQVSGKGGSAEDGVFDEICCTRVLCGVPHPQQTIKSLYNLLKPGGRMVICEHVANPWRTEGTMPARLMQLVYTFLGWPFLMGGCELQRHTMEFLRDAGEWDKFELKYFGAKDAIPFVVGELIKKHGSLDKSFAEVVKETDSSDESFAEADEKYISWDKSFTEVVKKRDSSDNSSAEVAEEQDPSEKPFAEIIKEQGSLDKSFAEVVKETDASDKSFAKVDKKHSYLDKSSTEVVKKRDSSNEPSAEAVQEHDSSDKPFAEVIKEQGSLDRSFAEVVKE